MLAKVLSGAVYGVDGYQVTVEVDAVVGSGAFVIVGLPDAGVSESKERVRPAIKNSGFRFPSTQRITANLAPADIRKEGSGFDLPLAVGIIASTGQIPHEGLEDTCLVGELSLDGALRPVSGILPIAIAAAKAGIKRMVVPADNAPEAAVVEEVEVFGLTSLAETCDFLMDNLFAERTPAGVPEGHLDRPAYEVDFSDVKGQAHAKRAMEIAAAGGHNMMMIGPPGSGKTMLARRLPSVLPTLSISEALEVTKLYSVAGLLPPGTALMTNRPFRSPHHTTSTAGLCGGGSVPKPGEISLAHHGVLFLDELPEYRKDALEVLRQPLEDRMVTISRARASLTYPASFMLVAAMNPCPCGFRGDTHKECTCRPDVVRRYVQRISGPMLDRIDIHIEVPRLEREELTNKEPGEPSAAIRDRVGDARERQLSRFRKRSFFCNGEMGARDVERVCVIGPEAEALLKSAVDRLGLSARAYHRVLKLARTIADLDRADDIDVPHVAEAVQYRALDTDLWG
jgi:magnesium chelatase family protein